MSVEYVNIVVTSPLIKKWSQVTVVLRGFALEGIDLVMQYSEDTEGKGKVFWDPVNGMLEDLQRCNKPGDWCGSVHKVFVGLVEAYLAYPDVTTRECTQQRLRECEESFCTRSSALCDECKTHIPEEKFALAPAHIKRALSAWHNIYALRLKFGAETCCNMPQMHAAIAEFEISQMSLVFLLTDADIPSLRKSDTPTTPTQISHVVK